MPCQRIASRSGLADRSWRFIRRWKERRRISRMNGSDEYGPIRPFRKSGFFPRRAMTAEDGLARSAWADRTTGRPVD